MRPYLEQLIHREHLTTQQATDAFTYATSGTAHDAEIAAFLALLSAKGETSDEVIGIVQALRSRMIPVTLPYPALDIVGTGGDGHSTVNISTAAAIAAAAAGCKVSKHGNRSVSSKSGSADVLEELGVNLSLSPEGVARCIDKTGIGFMYAPNHHPAMRLLAPVRKAMKIRSVMNIIGPLLSPVDAGHMVLGVYTPDLIDIMADVLLSKGVKRAVVVHTAGLDEYSNTGVAEVVEIENGEKRRRTFDAKAQLGMRRVEIADLKGGDAAYNAQIIRDVLSGNLEGPITDAIALNAGVGCWVFGLDSTIQDGVTRVREVLRSGQAVRKLDEWAAVSHQLQ